MKRLFVLICALSSLVQADYWSERNRFVNEERTRYMGSSIQYSSKENKVNDILMKYKNMELEEGFKNPAMFPPAIHFFKAKKLLENSTVFSILKQMPKGAALHIHDTALLTSDWFLKNVTYRDHLYGCIKEDSFTMAFSDPPPKDPCWKSIKEMRQEASCVKSFDAWLNSKFTLEIENPESIYIDINTVWAKFSKIFEVITPMITYRPVFEDYTYEVLKTFYDDNVFYVEMRSTLPLVYDLNGFPLNPIQVAGLLENVVNRFVQDYPDAMKMKLIYAPSRHVNNETVDEYLQIFQIIKEQYTDFIAGFDLVGQEDLGLPLVNFINLLKQYQADVKYFFHAGETNWNGMSSDMNVVDAVLLNTTRIGHGYAVTKHPKIMEEIIKRGIALEVNPISNQVLLLVKDLRNHPAGVLMAQNYPIVISCDDPGFWGAKGLSYDFYMAFMGLASHDADLKVLKQLALNSIKYSAMSEKEKQRGMELWTKSWDKFLDNIISQYS